MSTNEDGRMSWPAGWPDPATLERLANEMFASTSEPAFPAASSFGSPVIPDALTSPVTAAPALHSIANERVADVPRIGRSPIPVELPGETELQQLLGRIQSVQSIVGADPVAMPGPRATSPAFYFLDQARFDPAARSPISASGDTDAALAYQTTSFDVNLVRRDFPLLRERINGRPLVWLDNAATTQKPQAVIDRLTRFYEHENSNVHRAAHEMAARATDAYEGAREEVRRFLNASSVNEIVFLRGATEAINLVAQAWGRRHITRDDEIVISWLEHHANIVPWMQLAEETGARLRVIPVDDTGQIVLSEYGKLLGARTKLVAFAHVSNALGTITPAKTMIEMAHGVGAQVLLDGAQAVSHIRADVQTLSPDWYVFSGHKVFAPTGIGVLYGREALLNEMPPWQGGGSMIQDVTFDRIVYHQAPARFEAGTGNIADAVGLGAAVDYVMKLGMELIGEYEHQLLAYATRLLLDIPGLRIIGTAAEKAGVLSFVLDGCSPEDVGAALNRDGIAVRAGHHCAQPILRRFGFEKTVRASLALYNTAADVDALVRTLTGLAGRLPPRG